MRFADQRRWRETTSGLENPPIQPIASSAKAYAYRNKIVLHGPGRPGFYQEDNRTLVPIERCLLAREEINRALAQKKRSTPQ